MKDKKVLFYLILIIVCHIFLLSKLIFFPYPELFIYPYLTNNGLLPYHQIFDQHFPGLFFLPINLNNLGMINAEIARFWLYGIVCITQVLIFYTGKRLIKKSGWTLLVNSLYLIWQPFLAGWSLWIDSFLPLFIIPSFLFLFGYLNQKKSLKVLFLGGLFLGIGIIFKQVLIPLAVLLGIYLIIKKITLKEVFVFSVGVLTPGFFMIGYLLLIGVWDDFWYWTVIYNLTVYSEYGKKAAPAIGFLTRVGFIFGSAFLMFVTKDKKIVSLLSIYLIGTLICVYGRFDFIYFQTALPFALLALGYGLSQLNFKWLQVGILIVYLFITVWWWQIFLRGHIGRQILSFDKQTMEIASRMSILVQPKEKVFFLGTSPHLYQITNTLPAGNKYVFQFPWFYLVAEDQILDGIKQDSPRIVVVDDQAIIEESNVKEFAPQIYGYIQQNYTLIDQVGTAKILKRNEKY